MTIHSASQFRVAAQYSYSTAVSSTTCKIHALVLRPFKLMATYIGTILLAMSFIIMHDLPFIGEGRFHDYALNTYTDLEIINLLV